MACGRLPSIAYQPMPCRRQWVTVPRDGFVGCCTSLTSDGTRRLNYRICRDENARNVPLWMGRDAPARADR
jgi:hypothetical protein